MIFTYTDDCKWSLKITCNDNLIIIVKDRAVRDHHSIISIENTTLVLLWQVDVNEMVCLWENYWISHCNFSCEYHIFTVRVFVVLCETSNTVYRVEAFTCQGSYITVDHDKATWMNLYACECTGNFIVQSLGSLVKIFYPVFVSC